jgi:hypothetical protein
MFNRHSFQPIRIEKIDWNDITCINRLKTAFLLVADENIVYSEMDKFFRLWYIIPIQIEG